jgi:hypothetical protein
MKKIIIIYANYFANILQGKGRKNILERNDRKMQLKLFQWITDNPNHLQTFHHQFVHQLKESSFSGLKMFCVLIEFFSTFVYTPGSIHVLF